MFSRNENGGQDKEEIDQSDKKSKSKKSSESPTKSPTKTAHPRVPRKTSTTEDEAANARSQSTNARLSPRKSSAVR